MKLKKTYLISLIVILNSCIVVDPPAPSTPNSPNNDSYTYSSAIPTPSDSPIPSYTTPTPSIYNSYEPCKDDLSLEIYSNKSNKSEPSYYYYNVDYRLGEKPIPDAEVIIDGNTFETDDKGNIKIKRDLLKKDVDIKISKNGFVSLKSNSNSFLNCSYHIGLPPLSDEEKKSNQINFESYYYDGKGMDSIYPKYFIKHNDSNTGYFLIKNEDDFNIAKNDFENIWFEPFEKKKEKINQIIKDVIDKKSMVVLYIGGNDTSGLDTGGYKINFFGETGQNIILSTHPIKFIDLSEINSNIRGDRFLLIYQLLVLPYSNKKIKFNVRDLWSKEFTYFSN